MSTTTTALIADDEEGPREQLRAALTQAWPDLQIVAAAHNGADAWDAFLEHEPALCFLDIRMPGMTGIDVARRIGDRAQIVFVTAFDEHALTAFDAGAVDYVLKPVEAARIAQTVARLQARAHRKMEINADLKADSHQLLDLQSLLAQLSGITQKPAPLRVLQASMGREVRLIRCDDVIYFESDARYTRVVFDGAPDGASRPGDVLIRTPLKELLAQLDEQLFWQVHRSVIVNHRHIQSAVRVDEGQMHLTLRGRSDKLPVSRHFQGLFKGQ
jgi:DNA-binding LytR/AlgR family response regulator